MALHFMAVLGTSLYEPVYYSLNNKFTDKECQFAQTAVINYYLEELKEDGKVTIYVTEKAKTTNLDKREYTASEEKRAQSWVTPLKSKVVEGAEKPGLLSEIQELCEDLDVNTVSIPDCNNEEEIWDMFQIIYQNIQQDDEIIFDITHGFRSIPMLAIAVVNYANIIRGCKFKAIHYGAFEASKKVEINGAKVKRTNIIDLTSFSDLMSWSNAADNFIRFGNSNQMQEVFIEKYNGIPNENKREWSGIKKLVNEADVLSNTLRTSRGADVKRKQSSIKAAYKEYNEAVKQIDTNETNYFNEIEPLYELLGTVSDRYKSLDKEKNYEVGLSVVEWCIDNGMIQQGYTALEETIITYLCDQYELDDMDYSDREEIVNKAVNIVKIYYQKRLDENQILKKDFLKEEYVDKGIVLDEVFDKILDVMQGISKELSGVFSTIKDCRNDINHFGMRKDPSPYKNLENKLRNSYETFKEILNG